MSHLLFELIFAIILLGMLWPWIRLLQMLVSPKVTVRAKLVSKRSLSVRHSYGLFKPYLPRSSRCGFLSRSTGYGRFFGTFLMQNGEQIELQMYLERYRELNEGDEVQIAYKQKWLDSFKKLSPDEDNA